MTEQEIPEGFEIHEGQPRPTYDTLESMFFGGETFIQELEQEITRLNQVQELLLKKNEDMEKEIERLKLELQESELMRNY